MSLIPSKDELKLAFTAIKGVELPTIPTVVQECNMELIKPEPNIQAIAEKISTDAVLSGMVLKIVNSPYYGLKKKVESVQQGVMLLGLKNVKNVITSAGLRQSMGAEEQETFWNQSSAVASCAAGIASMVHDVSPDEAYMTGLFMDTGALVLLGKDPNYKSILETHTLHPMTICAVERESYHTDHAVIGYLLGLSWQLPEDVNMAVLHHHNTSYEQLPEGHVRSTIAVIQLAYCMVTNLMAVDGIDSEESDQMKAAALGELLLDEEDLIPFAQESLETV